MSKQPDQPVSFLDTPVAKYLMDSLRGAVPVYPHDTEAETRARRDAAVATLVGMRPRDILETMLAVEAITVNYAAQDCYDRAKQPDVSPDMAWRLTKVADSMCRCITSTLRQLEKQQARSRAPEPTLKPAPAQRDNPTPFVAPRAQAISTVERHPEYGYLH